MLAGFFMGWIRSRFSVPTFISSLALMFAYRCGAHLLTDSFPVVSFPNWFYYLGSGYLFGVIPFQSIIFVVIFIIMWFISKYTNINEYWQYVAKAILILGAVLIYQAQETKKA